MDREASELRAYMLVYETGRNVFVSVLVCMRVRYWKRERKIITGIHVGPFLGLSGVSMSVWVFACVVH